MNIKRGDLVYLDFEHDFFIGHEQKGSRVALVISSDDINDNSDIIIVALGTSKKKRDYYSHLTINKKVDSVLDKDTTILFEHIRSIDKRRITRVFTNVIRSEKDYNRIIDTRILKTLGISL